jgi:hypothetical protein
LCEANLREANLWGANLWGAKGIIKVQMASYDCYIQSHSIMIGCYSATYEEWEQLTLEEVHNMGLPIQYYTMYKNIITVAYQELVTLESRRQQ